MGKWQKLREINFFNTWIVLLCGENWKIFREITIQSRYIIKSAIEKLIWRNFCKRNRERRMRIFSCTTTVCKLIGYSPFQKLEMISRKKRNKHRKTVPHCGNLQIFPPGFFCKISVKLTFSLKSSTVNQFDEKILQWGKISEITTLCVLYL